MDKAKLKGMDLEILELWASHEPLAKIQLEYPKAKLRIQSYRKLGVVDSGRGVNWKKFKAVAPPQMRGSNTGAVTSDNQMTLQERHVVMQAALQEHYAVLQGRWETLQEQYHGLQKRLEELEMTETRDDVVQGALMETLQEGQVVVLETLQKGYTIIQERLERLEELVVMDSLLPPIQEGELRSGVRSEKPRNYRFDAGLLQALQERAAAEGISETEALQRAIEGYLRETGKV